MTQPPDTTILSSAADLRTIHRGFQRGWELLASAMIFVVFVLAWQGAVVVGSISPLLLPPPLSVAARIIEDLGDGVVLRSLASTAAAMKNRQKRCSALACTTTAGRRSSTAIGMLSAK